MLNSPERFDFVLDTNCSVETRSISIWGRHLIPQPTGRGYRGRLFMTGYFACRAII